MPLVSVGDFDIYYELHGGGPPVVLLSGFVTGGNAWEPVIHRLASAHTCLVMDHRGVGRTGSPVGATEYDISTLAGDVTAMIDHLGLRRPLVVGHSMGGFIALELAIKNTDDLSGIALVSSAACGASDKGVSREGSAVLFRTRGRRRDIIRGVLEKGMGEAIREAPDRIDDFERLLLSTPPTPAGFLGQKRAIETFDRRERLRDIRVPCAIVHGAQDTLIPPSSATFLKAGIPHATLEILPGVGHFPPIEATEVVARTVARLSSG